MQLSNWSEQELVSLARVYIKHKQFNRSQPVREELANRVEQERTAAHLQQLLEQLNGLKAAPLSERILSIFVSTKQAA